MDTDLTETVRNQYYSLRISATFGVSFDMAEALRSRYISLRLTIFRI